MAVLSPLAAEESTAPSGPGPRSARVSFSSSLQAVTLSLAVAVLVVVLLWAVVPGIFTSFNPVYGDTSEKLRPPGPVHIFGTDHLGRDVFSRVVYGTATSVTSALLAVAIGLLLGSTLGLFAGFFGGWIDAIVSRLVEVLLAIPGFLLSVIVIVSLGFSTTNAAIAVGISSVAVFARLMRAEVFKIKTQNYVEAAFLSGGTRTTVLFGQVLRNSLRSVLALAVIQFGVAILVISALAFLGYGNPPPAPDWGLLVAEGKDYMNSYGWLVFYPGLVIVLTVLSINRIRHSLSRSTP